MSRPVHGNLAAMQRSVPTKPLTRSSSWPTSKLDHEQLSHRKPPQLFNDHDECLSSISSLSEISTKSPRYVKELQATFDSLTVETPSQERVVTALQSALNDVLPPVDIITIEANIAAGKSTLMDALKARYKSNPDVVFLDEPVQKWMDRGLLQAVYQQELEKSTFQLTVLMSLAGPLFKAIQRRPKLIISERSPWSNFHTFAKVNLINPFVPFVSFDAYKFTFEELLDALPPCRVHMVYLQVSPKTALYRIHCRDRDSEDAIPLCYLEQLHETHESLEKEAKPHRFVTIDAEETPEKVLEGVSTIADELLAQYDLNSYVHTQAHTQAHAQADADSESQA